jgi:ribosomal protein S18 acetylase RimI-like enzyme
LNAVFRRGRVDDAARLSALAIRTFTDTYEAHNTPDDMRAYLAGAFGVAQQARELDDPAMITVLAESGAELIGYAQVRRKEAPACVSPGAPVEIYRFYVAAAAHGTGIAQRLMATALDAARDLGGRHVWLGVWERNARAIAFYAKSGFVDVGSQFFQLGDDRQVDRVLTRSLPERSCGECGAPLDGDRSCRDYFNDLLGLEWQVPGGPGGKAHFLAVASYNLQHPSAFAADLLAGLRKTLADVLAGRATVADALARARAVTDGSTRVRRRPDDPGDTPPGWPTSWPMTVRDVCDVPVPRYLEQVQAWATAVDSSLPVE